MKKDAIALAWHRDTIPPMEYDRYAVVKVKGAELFWIIYANSKLPSPNFIWSTSQNLTESEVRTELAKMKRTDAEINYLIQQAITSPR